MTLEGDANKTLLYKMGLLNQMTALCVRHLYFCEE